MALKEKVSKFFKDSEFTAKEQFGYSAGSFGNCMAQDSVGTYSEMFILEHMGLGKNAKKYTATLKGITKALDIVTAPIVGYLLDKSKPGQNRTLKFMFFSAIPLSISSIFLFIVPNSSATFKLIYIFLLYFLFNIADTFFDISLMTLSTRLSGSGKSRGSLFTISSFAGTLGSMLPGWLLPILISGKEGNMAAERKAYLAIALIFGLLGLIAMLVPTLTLKEQNILRAKAEPEEKTKIDFKVILKNKPLILLSLSQVIDSVRQVCYNALPYFYKHTLVNFGLKPIVEAGSGGLSYAGLASLPFVSKKMSSRSVVAFGYLYTGTIYVILLLFGFSRILTLGESKLNMAVIGVLIALAGMPNAAMGAARKILLADSVDYMEWKTYTTTGKAQRSEGMVFAFNTLVTRVSNLWKDLLITAGLAIVQFKDSVTQGDQVIQFTQSDFTRKGIFWLVVIPAIVGNIVPGVIMLFDNFTGERRKMIMDELQTIRAGYEAQAQALPEGENA